MNAIELHVTGEHMFSKRGNPYDVIHSHYTNM